jgi:ABC-type antimicrobial peptide transport system permease subunit
MKADIEGGYVAYYIIIFLVCIGVLNTVLMSVLERTGEFGVLKAIGTSPKRLFALIMAETMLLSGLSCIAGFLLFVPLNIWLVNTGFVLPEPIEFTGVVMSHMQGTWNPTVLYEPALIILVSTLVISIIPARRAAKIVPVEAMRSL